MVVDGEEQIDDSDYNTREPKGRAEVATINFL